jgi:DNA-binding transcriptional regulator YiaG
MRPSEFPRHDRGMQDICPSKSKNTHIYVRTLHDACVMLGGEHKLAAWLGVSVQQVDAWLNGRSRPPDSVFLRCLDLVESSRQP